MNTESKRCPWCLATPEYQRYHDEEWGVPQHDDRVLFEFLILEGAQAGLSWRTILERRAGYRKAFADFDAQKVARYTDARLEKLLLDPGIIRNRLKVWSARTNAQAFLKVQREFGSFATYQWGFVDGKPLINRRRTIKEVPARTAVSDRLAADLQQRGFKFVGTTIIYAHMQAVGMVNDHLLSCPRHAALSA